MLIIHDERLPGEYVGILKKRMPHDSFMPFGENCVTRHRTVYGSIRYHPDIYFFTPDPGTIIHAPCVSELFLDQIRSYGIRVILGKEDPGPSYPSSARYNACRVGKWLLHRRGCTDVSITGLSEEEHLESVDVKQGYTRCSVLTVGETAIITSDNGIFRKARKIGIEALEVSAREITLPGEEHGFIGGAGTTLPGGRVVLLGDRKTHPQHKEIEKFVRSRGGTLVDIPGLPIYDAGSLLVLDMLVTR